MATAIFTPYDMTNSESDLHERAGESIDVGPAYDADPGEGIIMHVATFADGTTAEVFADEIEFVESEEDYARACDAQHAANPHRFEGEL